MKISTVVRVDKNVKKEFQEICQKNGVKASEALRDFIDYVVTTKSYPLKKQFFIQSHQEQQKNE